MRAVFQDNIEATEAVLRIILDKDDLIVQSVQSQFELKNIYGRSVRLDVFAVDSTGKQYNIEIQRAEDGASEKRVRYNQSIMDTNHLPAGKDPKSLPDVYVIFFTESDIMGEGLPIYHVERIIQETGALFDDGEHIIYINGAYKGEDSLLGALIADFWESDPDRVRIEELEQRIRYLKTSEEGVCTMCRLVESIVERESLGKAINGFLKGLEIGGILDFATLVSHVVENYGISRADAEAAVRNYSTQS